ncbi:MAG: GGDEF domain-containing protein, partial [Thermoleophilia bacterium]
ETRRRLVEQSTRDPLTGLANHRAFFDRLDSEVERSRRRDRPLSIVIIDLDDFKRVNDRFGHLAGDRVLVEFARRLGEQARAEDTLGRIGGEEFAWLIPEADAAQAVSAAERARRVIADAPFDHAGRVTMSAGVAQIVTGMDARALVAVADAALYRAKAAGRNRTVAAPIS